MDKPVIEAFWVAEYNNGQALPEYDLYNLRVNRFEFVDHKNVLRFWWLPVTPDMAKAFPGLRVNPRLRRCAMDMNGSKGFVARRTTIKLPMGGIGKIETVIKCYIVGIEGGPRVELYPDGHAEKLAEPRTRGESQDILHHG
jgi:hypothetical protein